jgi:hypothetical protein
MTPKEKAKELADKFLQYTPVEYEYEYAKQCALIAVDEIIQTYHSPMDDEQIQEWQEVKQEINNLSSHLW